MQKSKDRKVIEIKRRASKPKPKRMNPEEMPPAMRAAFNALLDSLHRDQERLRQLLEAYGVTHDPTKDPADELSEVMFELRKQNDTYRGMMNATTA